MSCGSRYSGMLEAVDAEESDSLTDYMSDALHGCSITGMVSFDCRFLSQFSSSEAGGGAE